MLKPAYYFEEVISEINDIIIYKNVLHDEVIKSIIGICHCILEDENSKTRKHKLKKTYIHFVSTLIKKAEKIGLTGNIFRKYIGYLLLQDENLFSLSCENSHINPKNSVYKMAVQDILKMGFVMDFDLKGIEEEIAYKSEIFAYVPIVPQENMILEQLEKHVDKAIETLGLYYKNLGCGKMSVYKMFRVDKNNQLEGILDCDNIRFSDIIGYEIQKEELIKNTEAFLKGLPSNNVLLAGARGTGKSSCVKALANEYFESGLRVIEINKEQIIDLPQILKGLKDRGKYFVIFLDDLSFEDFEIQYKYMKSILEGGTEIKPRNVLFCATSNRRHIIQEKWSDKATNPNEEEIHTSDTVNEKLSLSDRFGLTIHFPKPTQQQYFDIVLAMAKKEKVVIEEEVLKKKAIAWELSQKGVSGRTAKQFIMSLKA